MKLKKIELLTEVARKFNSLQLEEDEEEYEKSLMYKKFDLSENTIDQLTDLLAKLYHVLETSPFNYDLLDKRLQDAQDTLIKACEGFYSERIHFNKELQEVVQATIIPYYRGRFRTSFSREISFLPLELRLYIYISLLHTEASPLFQQSLMDRIALTLHKANAYLLGDFAIFLSAWHKSRISSYTRGHRFSFQSCLMKEQRTIKQVVLNRDKILSKAEMTPETAHREFWYGLRSFSDLKSIHNIEAAKICLELFNLYFKEQFTIMTEAKQTLLRYYKDRDVKPVNELLKQEHLDLVTIQNVYANFSYTSMGVNNMSMQQTEQLNELQKFYIQNFTDNIADDILYFNAQKPNFDLQELNCPEKLSQNETTIQIEGFGNKLRTRKLSLLDCTKHIITLSTAIMNSTDWEIKTQHIIISLLGDLHSKLWLRDSKTRNDVHSIVRAMISLLKQDGFLKIIGEGWPVSVVLEDVPTVKKRGVILQTTICEFPLFTTHFYTRGQNLNKYNELIHSVLPAREVCTNWHYIENEVAITKAAKRIRSAYYKRVQEARRISLGIK